MNLNRIFDAASIASGKSDRDGSAIAAAIIEDQHVAAAKALDREREAAELIFAVWVGASDVKNQIRAKFREAAREMRVENREIIFVADAIGEIGVEIRRRLGFGIVVLLMNGKSIDGRIARENGSGSVAMMNVGVDDHSGFDGAVVLEAANGDCHIMQHAETFAVIRKSVMETAADVDRHAARIR